MFDFFKKPVAPVNSHHTDVVYGFEDAFESSAIGMAFVSFEGKWLKVNKSFARIVEYSVEELLQKKFQDITHPEDLQKDVDLVRDMVDGKIDHYQTQKRYISKSGRVVSVLLSVSFVRNPDGSAKHLLSQIVDLSDFEKLKQQTEKVEAQLKQLFEHMSEAFSNQRIVVDDSGKPIDFEFLLVNKAFEEILGLGRKDIINKRASIVVPNLKNNLSELVEFGGKSALNSEEFTREIFFTKANKWFRVHFFSSVKNEFATMFTDITDKKLAEEKMKAQIEELTKINDIMTNREIRIAELKQQIKQQEITKQS